MIQQEPAFKPADAPDVLVSASSAALMSAAEEHATASIAEPSALTRPISPAPMVAPATKASKAAASPLSVAWYVCANIVENKAARIYMINLTLFILFG